MQEEIILRNDDEQPKECFPACENDKAKAIYLKKLRMSLIIPVILLVIVYVVLEYLYLATYFDEAKLIQGLYVGFVIYHIFLLIKNRKLWKEIFEREAYCDSQIRVFDDYFTLTTVHDGVEIAYHRFLFSEIRSAAVYGDLISVTARGQIFFVDKSVLPEGSDLAKVLFEKAKKNSIFKPQDKKSILLLIPSILIIVITVVGVILDSTAAGQDLLGSVPYIGLLFTFLPVILCVIGIACRKNRFVNFCSIVSALIVGVLVVIFGLGHIGFSTENNSTDYDRSFLIEAEENFDIDFPDSDDFYSYEASEENYYDGELLRGVILSYENGQLDDFETDKRFMDRIPTALIGLSWAYSDDSSVMLYNKDTGEYNTMPEEEGRYRFIMVAVSKEYQEIQISEYYVDVIR